MQEIFIGFFGILFYVSGLLVLPICAVLWRKKRRTRALRWVFFIEVACLLVLAGFGAFSRGILEHRYSWFILMILANVVFTPFALCAAIYDYSAALPTPIAPATDQPVCAECNRVFDPQ